MSENNQFQFKKIFLTALILLLLLLVCLQAWYMFILKQQLEQIDKQQSAIQRQFETQIQGQDQGQAQTQDLSRSQTLTPDAGINEKDLAATPDAEATSNPADEQPQTQRQEQDATPDDASPFSYHDRFNRPLDTPTWDPYAEIERMQRDMDRMFSRRFNEFHHEPDFQRHFRQSMSTPEIDVKENAHQYMVYVNLPGTDENDISVTLDGQRLTIKGKQDYKKQNRDPVGNIIFQERRSGRFQRSITLSAPVYQNEMKTRLENGVLKIIIPKVKNGQWR